jgi:hypothetical protein
MSKISIIPPMSEKPSYTENTDIKFELTYAGRSLKRNSIKIVGELQILNGGAAVNPGTDDIKYDGVLGAHGLFRQITCEVNRQNIETIDNYPMVTKARYVSNNYSWDFMSSALRDNALQIGNDSLSTALFSKNEAGQNYPDLTWNSFCVSPFFALNMSDNDISGQKGSSTVTLYLNQKNDFLFGANVATATYSLRNVYLIYETVDGDNNVLVNMDKVNYLPQTLSSNNQQFSMTLPILSNAVSCVFHENGRAVTTNSYELEALPNVQRVAFNYNDINNAFVKYDQTTLQEMLLNYMNSWKIQADSKNMFSLNDFYNSGKMYGLGMDFGGDLVPLNNQAWGMNIQSDVDSTRPYTVGIIFHGVIQV